MHQEYTNTDPDTPFPWLQISPMEPPARAQQTEQKGLMPFGQALGVMALSHESRASTGGIRTDTVKVGNKATVRGNKVTTDTVVTEVFDKVDPLDR